MPQHLQWVHEKQGATTTASGLVMLVTWLQYATPWAVGSEQAPLPTSVCPAHKHYLETKFPSTSRCWGAGFVTGGRKPQNSPVSHPLCLLPSAPHEAPRALLERAACQVMCDKGPLAPGADAQAGFRHTMEAEGAAASAPDAWILQQRELQTQMGLSTLTGSTSVRLDLRRLHRPWLQELTCTFWAGSLPGIFFLTALYLASAHLF